MLSETIGPYNAIGRIAAAEVEAALAAGWRVTVVAKRLVESLHDRVEWVKLYVPPRGFALQWLTGRYFIKRAIGRRIAAGEFDVVHGHQPQIADLCDVYECHFLTRAAYERRCLETRPGLRPAIIRAQQQVVLHAEDCFYRRWNPHTLMLFNSELMREEWSRHYQMPPHEQVLGYPAPPWDPVTAAERQEARHRYLAGDTDKIVVGFLGGLHERKGWRRLVAAVAQEPDLFLLMGGRDSEQFHNAALRGRCAAVGLVESHHFYAACDLFVACSIFEPMGLVAYEAAARGVPVIATDGVGALPGLEEAGTAVRWDPARPIGPFTRDALNRREQMRDAAKEWTERHSADAHMRTLLAIYEQVAQQRSY